MLICQAQPSTMNSKLRERPPKNKYILVLNILRQIKKKKKTGEKRATTYVMLFAVELWWSNWPGCDRFERKMKGNWNADKLNWRPPEGPRKGKARENPLALCRALFWCLLLRLTRPQVCNNFRRQVALNECNQIFKAVANFSTCHALMHN